MDFTRKRKDGSIRRRFSSEADGIAQVVAATRPTVCFFGHHHARFDAEIEGVPCIGLNKVGCPGNLVAIDLWKKERTFSVIGEWPNGYSQRPITVDSTTRFACS